jgi:hypothetical protein
VSVAEEPGQIDGELADAEIVGTGFARILIVLVPKQMPLEAVTVYTVLTEGLITMLLMVPEVFTGSHVYVTAVAIADRVPVLLVHRTVLVVTKETGSGPTVTVLTVVVIPHPFCPLTV